MIQRNETIIVGVIIKVLKPVTLPDKYKTIFHGNTNLKPSTYVWWYPVKNNIYAKLVYEIQRWYKREIKIMYGIAGTMEI